MCAGRAGGDGAREMLAPGLGHAIGQRFGRTMRSPRCRSCSGKRGIWRQTWTRRPTHRPLLDHRSERYYAGGYGRHEQRRARPPAAS
eukprot:scaffold3959_cov128-Isochrysis_galbana.AAC.4